FSRPFGSSLFYVDSSLVRSRKDVRGRYVIGAFKFRTNADETIYVKTGISSASIDGAMKDLDTEIPGWNFSKVREAALGMWRKELSKIRVETPDSSLKATFYTALYHTMMAPNIFSDVDGYFKGADGKIHRAVGYKQYTVFSLWDTFRAEHPLFTDTYLPTKRANPSRARWNTLTMTGASLRSQNFLTRKPTISIS
ncbi:MAG: glycoside hydrolase family 92 protein, partial [Bacteroidetes bacterium]|nr:glycoside hydrolase family 92 protein [Bacteroidota bacterium]